MDGKVISHWSILIIMDKTKFEDLRKVYFTRYVSMVSNIIPITFSKMVQRIFHNLVKYLLLYCVTLKFDTCFADKNTRTI